MAARRLVSHHTQSYRLSNKQEKAIPSTPCVHTPATALLTKEHLHAYIHTTITRNLPYYKALARYRDRRNKLINYTSRSQYKNLCLYYRLTEKGLCLLKTRYALKPKSPV